MESQFLAAPLLFIQTSGKRQRESQDDRLMKLSLHPELRERIRINELADGRVNS